MGDGVRPRALSSPSRLTGGCPSTHRSEPGRSLGDRRPRGSPLSPSCFEDRCRSWRHQERIDGGLRAGLTTCESAELAAARKRVHELETDLVRDEAGERVVEGSVRPKRRWEIVAQIVSEDLPGRGHLPGGRCVGVRVLRLAQAQAVTRTVRHALLAPDRGALHRGAGDAPRGPGRAARPSEISEDPEHDDRPGSGEPGLPPNGAELAVVDRRHRAPDPRGQGVLRRRARRLLPPVVGWAIDSSQTSSLVVKALGMAIENRQARNPGHTVPIGIYSPTGHGGVVKPSVAHGSCELGSVVGFDGAGRALLRALAGRALRYSGVGVERLIQPGSAVRAPVVRADSPLRRARSSGDSVIAVAATFSSR